MGQDTKRLITGWGSAGRDSCVPMGHSSFLAGQLGATQQSPAPATAQVGQLKVHHANNHRPAVAATGASTQGVTRAPTLATLAGPGGPARRRAEDDRLMVQQDKTYAMASKSSPTARRSTPSR